VTNCNRKSASFILDYCNLSSYVKLLIAADDCKNGKPHPEPYNTAIRHFKAELINTIIFEDSETGFLSAKNTNCANLVLIVNEFTKPDLLKNNCIKLESFVDVDMNQILFAGHYKSKDKYEDIIKQQISYLPVGEVKLNPVSLKTGYICDIRVYDIIYYSGEKETVVLKISNLDNELSKTATRLDMYNLELYFYKSLAQIVGKFINVPKSYGTIEDGEKKGIIMEDLRNYKGEFNLDLQSNVKMLLKVATKIYKMHSVFYFKSADELIEAVKPLKTTKDIDYYGELIRNRFDIFMEKNKFFLSDKEQFMLTGIYNKYEKIRAELSSFPLRF